MSTHFYKLVEKKFGNPDKKHGYNTYGIAYTCGNCWELCEQIYLRTDCPIWCLSDSNDEEDAWEGSWHVMCELNGKLTDIYGQFNFADLNMISKIHEITFNLYSTSFEDMMEITRKRHRLGPVTGTIAQFIVDYYSDAA